MSRRSRIPVPRSILSRVEVTYLLAVGRQDGAFRLAQRMAGMARCAIRLEPIIRPGFHISRLWQGTER
jgi:hypothetical protein